MGLIEKDDTRNRNVSLNEIFLGGILMWLPL